MYEVEVAGVTYDAEVLSAGEELDAVTWTRRKDGFKLRLVVEKLSHDDVTTEELRSYLVWKLRYPWRREALKEPTKRELEVDGEYVEFSLDASSISMAVSHELDVSEVPAPKPTLRGRSNKRAATLEDPAGHANLGQYTDDELQNRWRALWAVA